MTDKPTTLTFNFNALIDGVQCNHEIRAALIDETPRFFARNVCLALGTYLGARSGVPNVSVMARMLGPDEAQLYRIQVKVGDRMAHRPVMLITEAGLYKLIMRSDKPAARPFQDWVTREVLPSIRKTGGYQLGAGETMPLPTSFAAALRQHASGTRAVDERQPPTLHGRGGTGGVAPAYLSMGS